MEELPRGYVPNHLRQTAIRIIKSEPKFYGLPAFHFDADFFVELVNDPRFCYETENEFVVYVNHTLLIDACLVTCSFEVRPDCAISAILCEKQSLYFERQGNLIQFNFEISGLTGPTRTLYVHTILREPGLTLRIEQNHVGRRAGKYKSGDYPATEIAAANHYMFAAREIVRLLNIPQYLNANHLGYLLILGFETNNEIHTDYPPHWHLIFRWPNHCGSPAPHIYLDAKGRMTHNTFYVDGMSGCCHEYAPGEWCRFVDMYGHDVCALRIEADGGMSITCPRGPLYRMSAFDSNDGVCVYRDGQYAGQIQTENDTTKGIFSISWVAERTLPYEKSYRETVNYDPLTGCIRSIKHCEETKDKNQNL